jgi:nitrate/TMAO reductase-like tetraheme cytochrome c subunit
MDSLRARYGQVALVDNGGYFPEDLPHQDAAWFLMDAMMLLGTDAVGVGDRDLRFGLSYLRENVKRSRLPAVSANLAEKPSGKLVFPSSIVVTKGTVKVGFLGLISDKADLGPARDSLQALDPTGAARQAVADLRKKGATVVVALSDLGKVESEDLASNVDGIDVVIAGRNVPVIQKGRLLKSTLVVYGGEKGQHVGRTVVALDRTRRPKSMDADVHVLGPEYPEKKDVATLVKSFRESLNEKIARAAKEAAAARALASAENSPDRFVGVEVCSRCHPAETEQWKGTAHSKAWQTLVDAKKDADPSCVGCHVVGYQKPGGFTTAAVTPAMSNVQCESCHGMGTQHEAYADPPRRITEATCRTCHNSDNSPEFSFAVYQPHVVHKAPANLPRLPKGNGMKKALGAETGARK